MKTKEEALLRQARKAWEKSDEKARLALIAENRAYEAYRTAGMRATARDS
jgi:hypothetical protein